MSKIKDLYAEVNGIDDLMPTDDDHEMAHMAYEIRKETVINELEMLRQVTPYEAHKEIIDDAIKLIKEGEV